MLQPSGSNAAVHGGHAPLELIPAPVELER
jgi:hypothetical protein